MDGKWQAFVVLDQLIGFLGLDISRRVDSQISV